MRYIIILGYLFFNNITLAREYPTTIDLRAAYCIKVTQNLIGLLKPFEQMSEEMKSAIQEEESKLNKLQTFVKERIGYIYSQPIITAMQSAIKDWEDSNKESKKCLANKGGNQSFETAQECIDNSPANDLTLRLRRCNSINWLPY